MTEIPDRPFDKIVMDLVADFTESSKGNKHILTIIDLLTGWPEAIPILNKWILGSWHQEDILCTIPPTKQWKTRNIPQIPQTNTKEDVC